MDRKPGVGEKVEERSVLFNVGEGCEVVRLDKSRSLITSKWQVLGLV